MSKAKLAKDLLIYEMYELLKKLEWSQITRASWDTFYHCPSCDELKENGHYKTCKLAALLRKVNVSRTTIYKILKKLNVNTANKFYLSLFNKKSKKINDKINQCQQAIRILKADVPGRLEEIIEKYPLGNPFKEGGYDRNLSTIIGELQELLSEIEGM